MMLWANLGATLADPSFWFSIRGLLATAGGFFAGFATYHSIEMAGGSLLRKFIKSGGLRYGFKWCPSLTIGVIVFLMLIGGGGGRGFGSGGGEGQGMAPTMKNPEEKHRWVIRVLGDIPLRERMGTDADRSTRYFPIQVSGITKSEPVNLEKVKGWLVGDKIIPGEITIELHPEDPDETTNPVRMLVQAAQDGGWKTSVRKLDSSGNPEGTVPTTKP